MSTKRKTETPRASRVKNVGRNTMSDVFITADEHYGHEKIIQYCSRPFTCADEMNEFIIEQHNKTVPDKKSFLTIHVGDLFWHTMTREQAERILGRLNGRHAFIYGNHDELMEKYEHSFREHLDWIKGENKDSGTHRLKFNNNEMTLCHYAMRVWNRSHKGSWMLYGHSHNELPVIGKSFDIGVDGHNFTPWSLEEIEEKMKTLPQHHIITNVWRGKEAPEPPEQSYEGSTVHPAGCICGFCRMGGTRA
jgi:calcineurin-like phosphoesterase family protein